MNTLYVQKLDNGSFSISDLAPVIVLPELPPDIKCDDEGMVRSAGTVLLINGTVGFVGSVLFDGLLKVWVRSHGKVMCEGMVRSDGMVLLNNGTVGLVCSDLFVLLVSVKRAS